MRVHRLWIREYRVLRDLELRFSPGLGDEGTGRAPDAGHSLDLLVGVNGTGKSTVLRALADVFRQIQMRPQDDDFGFRITYERTAGDAPITVANVDDDGERLVSGFRVWEGAEPFYHVDDAQQFSPPRYVTYTTGSEEVRLRNAGSRFGDPDDEGWGELTAGAYWRRERPGAPAAPSAEEPELGPNHVHVRPADLPLVTLCGLLDHAARHPRGSAPESALEQVLEELGIRGMSGFALRFGLEPDVGYRQDRERIGELQHAASRVRVQGASRLLVFDTRTGADRLLANLLRATGQENVLGLFQELARYTRPVGEYRPLLRRVEIFLEKTPAGGNGASDLHTYDWFSDGERTFLARMCMLSLFGASNALILLDEPEVHFNDYWKRKLLRLLDQSLQGHHSHAILTTHSSIVLTDARPGQIVVLDRDGEGFTSRPRSIPVPTFAGDPSDVMVTVFGAEQATGAKSSEEILRLLLEYAASGVADGPRRRRLRKKLEAVSRDLGPGYWRYRVADALENG